MLKKIGLLCASTLFCMNPAMALSSDAVTAVKTPSLLISTPYDILLTLGAHQSITQKSPHYKYIPAECTFSFSGADVVSVEASILDSKASFEGKDLPKEEVSAPDTRIFHIHNGDQMKFEIDVAAKIKLTNLTDTEIVAKCKAEIIM